MENVFYLNSSSKKRFVLFKIILTISYRGIISVISYVVRAFTHGVMGHQIDPSWWTH